MGVATAVRALRPDTLLDTVRTQATVDALTAARPSGQVVAICGLHDEAASSTLTAHLARPLGRLHPGRVVVLDADLDRGSLTRRTEPDARIQLDELEAFVRTPSSVQPSWTAAAPVISDAGAHPASQVTDVLRWARPRLDTVLIDVPARWRRAVLDSLLPSLDILVVTARAGHPVDAEIGIARHWLHGHARSDLAERLIVVESDLGGDGEQRPGRRRGGRWFHLGCADPAAGWAGLGRADRDELLRLAAALRV